MKIEVTQEKISRGARCQSDNCPIALAWEVAFPGCTHVRVTKAALVFWRDAIGNCWSAGLPPEATAFITAFDDGEPVSPFAFEVAPRMG
jgi:hypothetical protein